MSPKLRDFMKDKWYPILPFVGLYLTEKFWNILVDKNHFAQQFFDNTASTYTDGWEPIQIQVDGCIGEG